jgi:hypothetical protein
VDSDLCPVPFFTSTDTLHADFLVPSFACGRSYALSRAQSTQTTAHSFITPAISDALDGTSVTIYKYMDIK